MPKKEGLSRIEPSTDKRGGAWGVRISRNGKEFGTKFSDSMYKSSAVARKAAETFLRELRRLLPAARTFQRIGPDGLPGSVVRVKESNEYWRAMLSVDGKKFRKTYAISKYGDWVARRLAIETREKWLRSAGFYERVELPTDEVIAELGQRIRKQFKEQRGITRRGGFHAVEDYGLIRRNPDVKGKGGYWIVCLTRSGVHYRRQFGDSPHGGVDLAREAALQYRNDILASTVSMSRRERQQILSIRNTSGAVGVYAQRNKGILLGWYAQAVVRGKVQSRMFSISKYGPELAFELAVEARTKMLERVEGDCTVSPAGRHLSACNHHRRHTHQDSRNVSQIRADTIT